MQLLGIRIGQLRHAAQTRFEFLRKRGVQGCAFAENRERVAHPVHQHHRRTGCRAKLRQGLTQYQYVPDEITTVHHRHVGGDIGSSVCVSYQLYKWP